MSFLWGVRRTDDDYYDHGKHFYDVRTYTCG